MTATVRLCFSPELLNQSSRAFQIAYQLAYFEHSKAVEEIINGSKLENLEAQRLARLALINYAAAAILMPYGVFLQTAEDNGYDITLLSRRFGTSFEQVCHRLTTLQRPGAKGVPFFSFVLIMPEMFQSVLPRVDFTFRDLEARARVGIFMTVSDNPARS